MKMHRRLPFVLGTTALNAVYLWYFESPSLFYIANVFLHLGLGLVLIVFLVKIIGSALRSIQWEAKLGLVLLTISALTGMYLFFTGTSRANLATLQLHILCSFIAFAVLLLHFLLRHYYWRFITVAGIGSAVMAVAIPFLGLSRHFPIENPVLVPTRMEEEGAGPDTPFFPSSSNTNVGTTIPSDFFMNSETCGQSECHPDIYRQWQTSAHHIASFNNQWYRKSVEYMQDMIGTRPSKWCAGCHDHAVFFNGMMETPIEQQLDRPEAQVGLTCTSCHSIVSVGSTMGNGNFVIEYPPLHDLATSKNPFLKYLHDFIVKLDPGPHRTTFMKPFMRKQVAEYCSACHKVHLDVPVNGYRWLRGFNEYDGWQSSGVSGQGARSFYYPESPKNCADCHMPLVRSDDAGNIEGVVHDHRFPGANTAIATAHRFDEQLKRVIDFLQNDQIGIDIFALSESSEESDRQAPQGMRGTLQTASTFAEGDEMGIVVGGRGAGYTAVGHIIAPINKVKPSVRRGETVRVDVVVRTKGVGHFFPGGTVDAFEVWVELKAVDETGKLLFWSGYVEDDESGRKGKVDPAAHFYRSRMLDERGNVINKRNAWATRSVAYVRLIPPGAADTVHFRLTVPQDAGEVISLSAKVNYRKFAWWNTQWAYAGERDPADPKPDTGRGYDNGKWVFKGDVSGVAGELKEIPDLPIVTMAKAEEELRVVGDESYLAPQNSVYSREDLIRWNDYGIGLLLQGDLKAAEEVFLQVTEIDPSYVDGWVNVGRVRVQEGRPLEAIEVLDQALNLDPELARAHFFKGMAVKSLGKYDQALAHFREAESQYPRDRVVLNQIGRLFFLKREFQQAILMFQRVLKIDPEDLQAHYNLMLCWRALGDQDQAQREQSLYLRFKADESSQSIAGSHLRDDPHDNNERQAIHEHQSFPLEQII